MRRALVGSVDRGRETGIETWIERFRREFCLAPPADLDLESQVEAAWADEIERRVREMPASGAGLPSADEVFSRLRTHLAERRRAK